METVGSHIELALAHTERLFALHCAQEASHGNPPAVASCTLCQGFVQLQQACRAAIAALVPTLTPPAARPREGRTAHGRASRV
jgi:hypothetical protein